MRIPLRAAAAAILAVAAISIAPAAATAAAPASAPQGGNDVLSLAIQAAALASSAIPTIGEGDAVLLATPTGPAAAQCPLGLKIHAAYDHSALSFTINEHSSVQGIFAGNCPQHKFRATVTTSIHHRCLLTDHFDSGEGSATNDPTADPLASELQTSIAAANQSPDTYGHWDLCLGGSTIYYDYGYDYQVDLDYGAGCKELVMPYGGQGLVPAPLDIVPCGSY